MNPYIVGFMIGVVIFFFFQMHVNSKLTRSLIMLYDLQQSMDDDNERIEAELSAIRLSIMRSEIEKEIDDAFTS